jgi:hypothetical protein
MEITKETVFKAIVSENGIRALSWKQPFAALMLHDKYETRTWDTDYRGFVLICATQKPYALNEMFEIMGAENFNRAINMVPSLNLIEGHAIAVGVLANTWRMRKWEEQETFVAFKENLFVHRYKNVRAIKPIPFKGGQKWQRVPEEIINQIEFI